VKNNTSFDMKRSKTKKRKSSTLFSLTREDFMHSIYPVIAGVPTAILILYFFDFGSVYKDILHNLLSPIITGVVSGSMLYMLGIRR